MGGDLNASYYGPSVPPQKPTRRRGRSCLCGCGCCIFKFLFQFLFTILFTVLAIAAVAAAILWFIFRPNLVKFHADGASLARFNLSANDTLLRYDLAVNVTIRNPNRRLGIYYDRIEAGPVYQGQGLDSKDLAPPFYQGHKNTTALILSFSGEKAVVLGGGGSEFERDRSEGVFGIDLKLYLKVRFKFGIFKSPQLRPKIKCGLKVPLGSGNASSKPFERTRCDFDLF